MWRWVCRSASEWRRRGALQAPRRQLFTLDPAAAIAALRQSKVKVEVCNSIKVEKGAPPAQASFLDLPDDVGAHWWLTGSLNRKLLIRNCYDPIFNLVWEHNEVIANPRRGVVLLGDPGIGKTGFLWFALWKLLGQKLDIIIKLPTSNYICVRWIGEDQVKVEECERRPSVWESGRVPWYLADRFIPNSDWGLCCKFLLTCSPLKANFYEFAKSSTVRQVFDPVWTEDELLALNEHNFGHDPEDVRKRFHKWGGIPRYVLEKVQLDDQEEITRAIGLVREYDQVVKLQSLQEDQSHKAFHMIVDESTYSTFRIAPASAYVERQLLSNLPLPGLKRFLSVEQRDGIRDIQGKILEGFACDVLIPKGGKLQYRELKHDGEFGPICQGSFPAVSSRYELDRRAGGGHEAVFPTRILPEHKNALFKPSSARNAQWDFIANGSVFQVTVTKERALRLGGATERALEFLRSYYGNEEQLDFCILVPVFNLSRFTIDWFDSIKPVAAEKGAAVAAAAAEKAKRRSQKDKGEIVQQVMKKLQQLNIKVKLVSLDVWDVCPACMGTGFISRGDQESEIVSSVSALGMSRG